MPKDRRHAAIMFSDIVGFTAMMGSNEDKTFEVLSKNREIHQQLVEKYNGTLIKELGDGNLISFNLASDAVYCAIEIQKKCKEQDIPLKIGIHEGELVFEGADVLGDAVNVASRLESDTKEGCIYISGSVYRDIKNRSDIHTKYVKEKTFKNVDEPIKVYEVLCDGVEIQHKSSNNLTRAYGLNTFRPYYLLFGTVVLIIALLLIWKFIPFTPTPDLDKSIAVKPFWNESNDTTNMYFVNGMMEDIRNNLSKISDLRVISRTTMEKYRETKLTASEIAKEVGVSYLLEGSVQKMGNQVKIHAQLINAEEDDHVWQDTYTKDIGDIKMYFEIQSEISKTIAEEIGANIKSVEGEHIDAIPTSSPLAYDYYLRGKEIMYAINEMEDIESAIQMYEKAVAIDSSFALAWVGLAESNRWLYWVHIRHYSGDKNDHFKKIQRQIDKTKKYLDKAIALAPELMEVRREEGAYYYQCKGDYTKALQISERLSMDYPNDDATLFLIAIILRRTGELEKSIEYSKKATSLNPSNWLYWNETGNTLVHIRKYKEAEKYYKKAIILNPTPDWYNGNLFELYISYTGEYKKAKQYLDKLADVLPEFYLKYGKAQIFNLEGEFYRAISELDGIAYDSTVNEVNFFKHLGLGWNYDNISEEEKAKENYKKAKEIFELNIPNEDKEASIYSYYALSLAGLGMKEQAIDTVNKALEIQSYSGEDTFDGYTIHYTKAKILAMVGENDEAIKKLEYILKRFGGIVSVNDLKHDPFWKPLRDMEGFKALLNNPEYQPR